MQKSLTAIVVLGIAAFAGYYLFLQPSGTDNVLVDTMPAGEEMDPNNDMIGGDAAADDSGTTETSDAEMMEKNEGPDGGADEAMMEKNEGAVMEKKEDTTMEKNEEGTMVAKAEYLAYTDGVIGNGKTSVLFFHAPWCPSCRQGDKDLAGIYSAGTATLNTYKVDYDTATDLKAKYGVTTQHTFVLIDGTGKALKTMVGASASQLAELVKG